MRGLNRAFLLIVTMTLISLIVVGIATFLLYRTAFDEERTRLVETAQSQARLIEAIARHDGKYSVDYPGGAEKATLDQIKDAHASYEGFGETGEVTLARRVGDEIIFLLRHRHTDLEIPKPVSFESELAEPMRLALSDLSGTVVGLDYRGMKVLAAYEPVGILNLGIVAKIALVEIRSPFIRSGLITLGFAFLAIVLGAMLFFRITNPMIRKLAESEERFRSLVEASPDGITLTDLDGKILMCNPQTVKLHGFESQEEIIGKSSIEFIAPEGQQRAMDNIKKTIQEGTVRNVEYNLLKKDGNLFSGELNASLITDRVGNPVAFMAVTRDITEQKQAEEDLRESEQMWKSITENTPDHIMLIDLDGNIQFINHTVPELTVEQVIGTSVFNYLPEESSQVMKRSFKRVLKTKEDDRYDVDYQTKDGKIQSYEGCVTPIEHAGQIISFLVSSRNITERKKAEDELRESEERYRHIYEYSPLGIGISTLDGQVVDSNKMMREITGYSTEDFEKVKLEETYENKEDRKKLVEAVGQHGYVVEFPTRLKRKDGTSYDALLGVSKMTIEDTGFYHTICQDITEQKKTEKEKKRLQAQLIHSEKMAGIGTLTSGIAHEFNNLLQIMSGHSEYAQRTKKTEDMEEALDIVGNTSDRVSRIIKDLLTFSRRETQEKDLSSIPELIDFVLSMTEEQLKKNNITVVREYGRVPKIEVNQGEIQQVFLNMVTNARDAMLPKGGTLEIGIKKVKDNVEISFTDMGIGIEEKNLGSVFEPFYTTKGAVGGDTRIQGIGLGLSVSYGIVQRHGGTIEVESKAGKETTFTIRLPAKVGKAEERVVKEKSKPKEKKTKPRSVLVVDDEEEICKMLMKWLSAEGHKVKSSTTGEKALDLVKKESFDIVFLDIVMPGILAIDTLAEIKEISPKTKVFMITGKLVDKDLWKELKAKGASGYLQKPFKIENIKNCLAKIKD